MRDGGFRCGHRDLIGIRWFGSTGCWLICNGSLVSVSVGPTASDTEKIQPYDVGNALVARTMF